MSFLRNYLEWGLSQVVVIDHKWEEEQSGYQNEHTWETVVARKGRNFVKVVAYRKVSFAPRSGGSDLNKESETPITPAEYRKAAREKEVLDTPEAVREIEQENEAQEARYAREAATRPERLRLAGELDKVTPKCPGCGLKMSQKKNKQTRRPFWGCPTYPRCDGTATMSSKAESLIADLAKL